MDNIADMLTRIRNALRARHVQVKCPSSKIKIQILDLLVKEGYITSFTEHDLPNKGKEILIDLKYHAGSPAISQVLRISKPGRRVYRRKDNIGKFYNGFGTIIVSTPKGLMTDYQIRKMGADGCGGEVMFKIY